MKSCAICNTPLEVRKQDTIWYCPTCDREFYANPVPGTDVALFDTDGRVLLGVRANEPNRGKLNLPGGFMDMNETIEEAAERELQEELGLQPADYSPLQYVGSRVDWYTQYGEKRQVIVIMWAATLAHRDFPVNEEVTEYFWKLPSELQPQDLTHEGEYEAIQKAAKLLG